jgi:hypothetical protein
MLSGSRGAHAFVCKPDLHIFETDGGARSSFPCLTTMLSHACAGASTSRPESCLPTSCVVLFQFFRLSAHIARIDSGCSALLRHLAAIPLTPRTCSGGRIRLFILPAERGTHESSHPYGQGQARVFCAPLTSAGEWTSGMGERSRHADRHARAGGSSPRSRRRSSHRMGPESRPATSRTWHGRSRASSTAYRQLHRRDPATVSHLLLGVSSHYAQDGLEARGPKTRPSRAARPPLEWSARTHSTPARHGVTSPRVLSAPAGAAVGACGGGSSGFYRSRLCAQPTALRPGARRPRHALHVC